MSSKSNGHRAGQAAESRLLDESEIEQRAMRIARLEGRELSTSDDRARAREELLAPEDTGAPEAGGDVTAWDEAPGTSGRQVPKVKPEDEKSIGKELAEKGIKGPRATRKAF
jgi:monoamine oxidase